MWRSWVKVNLSLGLINSALCHIDVEETRNIITPFLTWALEGGEWSASQPFHFNPKKTAQISHCTEGWVGPRDSLDIIEKKNLFPPLGVDSSTPQPSTL
jgi:hypothetical protein